MTQHRPLLYGWIKNMYIFHANVVKSCDMSWFLIMSIGLVDEANRIMTIKRDACYKMWVLYFVEQRPRSLIEIPGWIYLYQPWQDYIRFHLETAEYNVLVSASEPKPDPECLMTEGQDPIWESM